MFLVRPCVRYKASFLEGLREFHREGRNLRYDISELDKDFESFVLSIRQKEDADEFVRQMVPETVFWLIDSGEYIGRISIRHWLNEYLHTYGGHIGYEIRPSKRQRGYGKQVLRLGLQEAGRLGLEKVLVICSTGNIGSKKIIEGNGGILENEIRQERDRTSILRYWIEVF